MGLFFPCVLPVQGPQALEDKVAVVDYLPAAVAHDALGKAARGNHRAAVAQLRLHALDHAVQQRRRAVDRAGAHAVHRVGGHHLFRRDDGDVGQKAGAGGKGGIGQLEPRHDGAALVAAVLVDDHHGGGGAHVHNDDRGAVAADGRHAGDYQIRRHGGGVVDAHIQPGLHARAHDEGSFAQGALHRKLEALRHRRHHGGDDGPLHVAEPEAVEVGDLAELEGVLRAGEARVGVDAHDMVYLPVFNGAEDDVGVAYVYCKNHLNLSFLKPSPRGEGGSRRLTDEGSVIYPVVGIGACQVKGPEAVAVVPAPDDELLHRGHGVVLDVVQQHNAPAPPGAAADDVFDYLVGVVGLPRVAGGHVPVIEPVAQPLHHSGKPCHDAGIEAADGVGRAAGEAEDGAVFPGLLIYYLLHGPEILQPGLFAGIYLVIVVGVGVHADAVALPICPAYKVVVIGVCGGDKEGGGHAVGAEYIQQPPGVGAGAVIKGEINCPARRLGYLGQGPGQHIHRPGDGHALAVCAHEAVAEVVFPHAHAVHTALKEQMPAQVIAQPINGDAARVCVAVAGVDLHILIPHQRETGGSGIVGQRPLGHGLVAGGVGNAVHYAVCQLPGLDLVRQVPVIAVVGPVAFFHIAVNPAGAVALHIHKLDDRGLGVHHMHHAPGAEAAEEAVHLVVYIVAAQSVGVHLTLGAYAQMPVALAEDAARADGVDPRLHIGAALLYLHLLLTADVEAHPPPVGNQGEAEHQYQPRQQGYDDKRPAAGFFVLFIFHTTYPLYIM